MRLLQWIVVLMLFASTTGLMAQGPYPNQGNMTVCLNSNEPYGVPFTVGSTYAWSIIPSPGGNGIITPGATPNLITVNWNTAGICNLQVIETNASGCVGAPFTIVITVNDAVLPPVSGGDITECAQSNIQTITAIATVPAGVNIVWYDAAVGGNIVASPTLSAIGTVTYYAEAQTAGPPSCVSPTRTAVTLTINPSPTPVITGALQACVGSTGNVYSTPNVLGNTYAWVVTNGTITAGDGTNSITVTWNGPTPGTVQVTETVGSCSAVATLSVTINPVPVTTGIYHN